MLLNNFAICGGLPCWSSGYDSVFQWRGWIPGWRTKIHMPSGMAKGKKFLNSVFFSFFKFIWLCQVIVAALGSFSFCCMCGILSCSMWTFCCGMWDLVPWPEIELGPPALRTQSLSHWISGMFFFFPLWNFVCFLIWGNILQLKIRSIIFLST